MRFTAEELRIDKGEFDHMMTLGIVRPSNSPRALGFHMVPQQTLENCRNYCDFRLLCSSPVSDCEVDSCDCTGPIHWYGEIGAGTVDPIIHLNAHGMSCLVPYLTKVT